VSHLISSHARSHAENGLGTYKFNVIVWHHIPVMAVLWNRAGHYIFALWFLLSIFVPRVFSAVADWMSAILPHMVWSKCEFKIQV